MDKKELRKKYKELRSNLSFDEIEEKSLKIANQLLKLDIWNKTYYHLFLPIEEQKEVNTEYILQILAGKDKEVIVSKSNFETITMTHFLLTDNTKIKKNQYNIPEPVEGIEVPANKIQVIFIPLLAFDTKGNRIGYGKGFYDRFLKDCSSSTIKIGLSFFPPEESFIERNENDISLNMCVTDEQIFNF